MEDFSHCGYVKVNNRCVYTRFDRSRCTKCADICPTDAILITTRVTIKKDACLYCGLCYAACNNSAIDIKMNNGRLINSCEKEAVVDIGCIFSDGDQKVACISRITDDILVSFVVKNKKIIIRKGECENCKLNKTLFLFDDNMKKVLEIIKALDLKNSIQVVKSLTKDVHIPKYSISRREILSNIFKPTLFTKRDLLKDNIKGVQRDVVYHGSYRLKINSNCSICGICEYACPQDAILIKRNDSDASIYFNSSLCTTCDACIEACIKDALEKMEATVSDLIPKAIKLINVKRRICSICESEFYSCEEREVCYSCEESTSKREQLINFFKSTDKD